MASNVGLGENNMKKLVLAVAIGASFAVSAASAQSVYVKPHVRSDGTYVQGHYRTAPNQTLSDNYSTSPNYNPYTGKRGTVDPYAPPRVQSYEYKPFSPPQTFKPKAPPKRRW